MFTLPTKVMTLMKVLADIAVKVGSSKPKFPLHTIGIAAEDTQKIFRQMLQDRVVPRNKPEGGPRLPSANSSFGISSLEWHDNPPRTRKSHADQLRLIVYVLHHVTGGSRVLLDKFLKDLLDHKTMRQNSTVRGHRGELLGEGTRPHHTQSCHLSLVTTLNPTVLILT